MLWSQNCLKGEHARVNLTGGHVLWKDMSFWSTYHSGCMSYRIMSHGRSSFVGEHVLLENMSFRSACLQDGISHRMMCLTERHFLLEDRSYLRVCLIGGHV